MKHKIVLVPFPFDDLSGQKLRPAVCLTEEIKPYDHVILAFITSRVVRNPSDTDYVIDAGHADFAQTGLKVSSMIRLHRLMTVSSRIIRRELGELSQNQ
jgi:mRNA interferase MazF